MDNLQKNPPTKDPNFLTRIRQLPCLVCAAPPPNTVSHIKTRGSGGGDDWFNCVPKCIDHHIEWGRLGAYMFCQKYPHFKEYLQELGWFFDGYRLKHLELMKGHV